MRGPPGPEYDRRGWGPRGRMGPPMMDGRGPPGGPMGPGFRGGFGGPSIGHPQDKLPPPITVDREKTCPLLLRVFPKKGGHHRLEEYAKRGAEPEGELQIYTWPDATLRELTELIKDVRKDACQRMVRLAFSFVYPDRRGQNVMKEVRDSDSYSYNCSFGHTKEGRATAAQVGVVWAEPSRRGPDDNKSLHQLSFQTGDFLDVAILH